MATSPKLSSPESKPWSTEVNKVRLTLLIALMFTTLGAGVFRTPSLILMTALLMGAPVVGIIVSRIANRSIIVKRHLPNAGTVGDTISGDITVRNNALWPVFMAHTRSGEVIYRDGDEDVAAVVPVDAEDTIIPVLHGRETVTWRQSWRLQRRGVFRVSAVRAGVLDPLELYTRLPAKTDVHHFTVLPRPVRVSQLSFLGSISTGKQLPQHAIAVADATDFHGVRPWRPGEGLRRVHWKNTARTGHIHVVEWEEALASDTAVLLDTQAATIAGRGADSTLEVAITLTASIAAYLLENGYQFELFHWQQTTATKKESNQKESNKQESNVHRPFKHLKKPPNAASSPELKHYRSANASHIRGILHALAEVQPAPSADATLLRLCEQAVPLLSLGRSVLIVSSSLADVQAGLHRLDAGAQVGGLCQALVLDAESFGKSLSPATTILTQSWAPSRQMRVVRRGDSLAAVLEQQW